MRANPIRFTGMASGMDTDSIVRDLMRPQQYKVDQEKKAQALMKLKQDAWKEMNTKLYNFHTKFTHKLSLASTYDETKATASNPDAIEIDNKTRVPAGTHNITIEQLATSTSVTGKIDTGKLGTNKLDTTTTVGQLSGSEAQKIELKMLVNKEEVTVIVDKGDTLSGVAQKMNKELKDKGFTARYDATNGMFFINSTKSGKDQTINIMTGHEMKKNDKWVEGGKEPEYVATQKGSGLLTGLGLNSAARKHTEGLDAMYTYNGIEGLTSSSNQIEVNGMQATLKAMTTEPITISAVANPDATYDFIKEFVAEYNTLIEEINEKIGTKPAKDIEPLTAEERESMSDTDIKLWEDKLNASLFYRDKELTQFVDSARSILTSQFGSDLSSLGIVTGPWQEKGKLHILGDEDDDLYANKPNKLKEKLAEDPNAVMKKFEQIGKALYEKHNKTFTSSNKLKSAMNFYNDKVMADKVTTFDKRIATLEERMYKMEDMQYRKFAAMEKMLSQLNNQGSWLAQQFGGN